MIHTLTIAAFVTLGVLAAAASFLVEYAWRWRQRTSLSAERAWKARIPPPGALDAWGPDEGEEVDLEADERSIKTPLRKLLQRRPDLYTAQLGAATLPELERDEVIEDVEFVAYLNLEGPRLGDALGSPDGPRIGGAPYGQGGPVLLPCPIWEPGPDGVTVRSVTVVPEAFTRYLYGPGTQDRLRDERELQEVLADAYLRMQKNPLEGIVDTWEIRSMFGELPLEKTPESPEEGTAGRAVRLLVEEVDYEDHFRALTTLMADACRRLAAGTTLEELRAAYKVIQDPKLQLRAEQRLAQHRRVEMRWFVEGARTFNPKKAEQVSRRLGLDEAEG